MEKIFFVCHGKTELHFVEYIASTCRIPIEFIAKKSGRSSIQINMLNSTLSKEIERGKLRPSNLNEYDDIYVLMLMDLDELREMPDGSNLLHLEQPYKDGTLLTEDENLIQDKRIHYLTFYNDANMEDVLARTEITVPEMKRDIQKIFPLQEEVESNDNSPSEELPIAFKGIGYVRDQFALLGEEVTTVPQLINFLLDRRKIL